ncbi:MAG TPA: PVC-type heme-binding CxxCH protein [Planctomicrobium sp.]|nr:PVC-type heme-binding CxxCH protein [Planctomicrobium sp.]
MFKPIFRSIALCLSLLSLTLVCLNSETWGQEQAPARAGNADVEKVIREFKGLGQIGDGTDPLETDEALKRFKLDDGLKIELIAAEPKVMQPLYLSFDERGRMWVTQYLQYPFPAGLKIIRYDQYLRAIFDDVPRPPPHHVPGKDLITVFEDTDGDGVYDSSKDVITGLNIATAAISGRGGIWVMNTPYLLFYPDANGDDIPDGDPEVRLSGFGLEDTHAVANSLAWGPDGWLYGAMGSTTTANVSSKTTKDVRFEGQCIWRYHPETDVFEVFAEGGGNTFSLEFDSVGRLFSGTNHGNTRGMYYPQGSYGEKNFGKHGPLTNPYAFGYFSHMGHEGDRARFPQTFVIYEGGTLPERYAGHIIAANALHHRVWGSAISSDGSTYKTVDDPNLVETDDTWFRPVDVKVGPDGAVYLADWYDSRLSHVDPRDTWHKESGRIYRIQGKEVASQRFTDFSKLSDSELIERFTDTNKWKQFTAVRVLSDRLRGTKEESSTLTELRILANSDKPGALQALWTLASAQQVQESELTALLAHPQEHVRRWAVRLLGDARQIQPDTAQRLVQLAKTEANIQVRSQLASTARRLATPYALPILVELIQQDDNLADPHLPLLIWWGLESHCGEQVCNSDPQIGVQLSTQETNSPRAQLLDLFRDQKLWSRPIVQQVLASRLMRRFALEGIQEQKSGTDSPALLACEQLLQLAPADARSLLMGGFLEAYQGREIAALPAGLKQSIQDYQKSLGESDLVLGVRLGDAQAVKSAIQAITSNNTDLPTRFALIETFGEIDLPQAVPALLGLLRSPSSGIKKAALQSLTRYSDPKIGQQICALFQSTLPDEHGLREASFRVLASRGVWTTQLLDLIERNHLPARAVPHDIVQQLRLHPDEQLQERINRIWGRTRESSEEKTAEIARVRKLLTGTSATEANMAQGKQLYTKHCATCHTLFSEGGQIGPNLTGYERSNLDFMLLAVIDPSAGIREEYIQFQVVTEDGRILTGLVIDQTPTTVTIRSANNQTTVLAREEIEILQAMTSSLMPEGLLKDLSEEETVALFQYLMQPTPTAVSKSGKE